MPGEDGEKPLKDFVSSILVQHEARTILGSALTVRGTSLFVNGVPPRKDEVLTIKDSRGRDTMLNSSINVAWMKTDSSAVGSEEFARKVRFVIIVVNETKLENQIRFVRRFEGKMDGGQLNLRLGLPSDSTVGIEESESYWVWQLA